MAGYEYGGEWDDVVDMVVVGSGAAGGAAAATAAALGASVVVLEKAEWSPPATPSAPPDPTPPNFGDEVRQDRTSPPKFEMGPASWR